MTWSFSSAVKVMTGKETLCRGPGAGGSEAGGSSSSGGPKGSSNVKVEFSPVPFSSTSALGGALQGVFLSLILLNLSRRFRGGASVWGLSSAVGDRYITTEER